MSAIRTIQYNDWREFKADFVLNLFGSHQYRSGVFLFRGHRDANWKLESSFDRWFKLLKGDPDRLELSERLLALFKKECEGLEIDGNIRSDDIRMLALGQHYGLPTRLLDWTESPYIAIFFALIDFVAQGASLDPVAIWCLDTRKRIWSKELGVEIVNVASINNLRLRNQKGRFTLSRTPFGCLEDYVHNFPGTVSQHALTKILLPATQAEDMLTEIEAMGISHSLIFPEFLGCALAAKMRLLLEL